MSKNPKERIKELRTLLHHYNVEYYVHSRSLISDFEFDHLMKELEELEEKYPVFYDENSPSKRVGGEVTKSFKVMLTNILCYLYQIAILSKM